MPLCAAFLLAPYGFLAGAALGGRVGSLALFWLPLAQIAATLISYTLLLRRVRMPLGMVLLHAVTVGAIVLVTTQSAYQVIPGGGITRKRRTYDFPSRNVPVPGVRVGLRRIRLAAELPLARLVLAALLVVLARRPIVQAVLPWLQRFRS